MVALDENGDPVHDALLWNDVRSAGAATELIEEIGGDDRCAELTGSVFNASYTITKLRWMRDHEPDAVARIHDVMLPHDYLTWQLTGRGAEPTTDRGDASGTGYWSPTDDAWLPDLLAQALGREARVPRIATATEVVGTSNGVSIAPGTGDNMAAALGLGLRRGDVAVSIGTSGVASMVTDEPIADGTRRDLGFRRCDRAVPAARLHDQRRADPRARCPVARRRPPGPGRAGARVGARRPRPDAAPLPRRRADSEAARTRRAPCTD